MCAHPNTIPIPKIAFQPSEPSLSLAHSVHSVEFPMHGTNQCTL